MTEVKKKAAAEAEYGTAVSQGHTAVLAKQEEGNVFSVDIGNLEAMQVGPARGICCLYPCWRMMAPNTHHAVWYYDGADMLPQTTLASCKILGQPTWSVHSIDLIF